MAKSFRELLNIWKGTKTGKEAAEALGISYPYYRLYACGKRTPGKLARIELERRMENAKSS